MPVMSQILAGTIGMLDMWGRWGRGANLGLPTVSPPFGNHALRTPLYSEENPDPLVMAVDGAVCRIPATERAIIIRKYQQKWQVRQFMREYKWSVRRYYAELERAIYAIHIELDP